MWDGISISPKADPQSVAMGLKDSFNDEWIRQLVKHFNIEICELCGDPRCTGEGVGQDPHDSIHADGACICYICGDEYRRHPMAEDVPGCDGPFLVRLCDGQLVKL